MADTTDTPKPEAAKPATVRRRAPRKTTVKSMAAKTPGVGTAPGEEASTTAAKPTVKRAPSSPKPRSSTRAAAPRATTKAPRKATTPAPKSALEKATNKVGGKWGAAAIAGGVAAVGAAAALLSLRGSTPKSEKPIKPPKRGEGAHQADGTNSSASFKAGIADEGTIPE